jgi:hypothetical protein
LSPVLFLPALFSPALFSLEQAPYSAQRWTASVVPVFRSGAVALSALVG